MILQILTLFNTELKHGCFYRIDRFYDEVTPTYILQKDAEMDQFGQALFPDAGLNMGPGMLVMNISPILN